MDGVSVLPTQVGDGVVGKVGCLVGYLVGWGLVTVSGKVGWVIE